MVVHDRPATPTLHQARASSGRSTAARSHGLPASRGAANADTILRASRVRTCHSELAPTGRAQTRTLRGAGSDAHLAGVHVGHDAAVHQGQTGVERGM
eukprot:429415-Lingulodinium_polyedra.AAC.1